LPRAQALELTTHRVTTFIRNLIPDAPPITVARLRHTAWAHAVGESKVHPILMQLQTDRKRMEFYSHSFYACVSRNQLQAAMGTAQGQLMTCIHKAYSEGAPSWAKFLGKPVGAWPMLPRNDTKQKPEGESLRDPSGDFVTVRSTECYGARYCPRFETIQALVRAELHNLAHAMLLHETHEAKAQAWHDALVYLVVLLSALTGGTRIGEIVELFANAVDLAFEPPLLTLLGKANRFTEESRTQCVVPRLLPLWQELVTEPVLSQPKDLQVSGVAGSNLQTFKPFNLQTALCVHTKRGRLRPISRRDVWEHLRAIAVQAGIAANEADYAIRFHACRHFTISWLIAHGSRFKDEGYWFGHQTAGNELLHPIAGSDLHQHWDEMTMKLHELLDALGVTEAVVRAIAACDVESLQQILPPSPQSLFKSQIHTGSEEDATEEETDDDLNGTNPISEFALSEQ
jgi:Phage integrase family